MNPLISLYKLQNLCCIVRLSRFKLIHVSATFKLAKTDSPIIHFCSNGFMNANTVFFVNEESPYPPREVKLSTLIPMHAVGSWTRPAEVRVLETKNFSKGQPVPWRFKPGTTATITWLEVVRMLAMRLMLRSTCRPRVKRIVHCTFSTRKADETARILRYGVTT